MRGKWLATPCPQPTLSEGSLIIRTLDSFCPCFLKIYFISLPLAGRETAKSPFALGDYAGWRIISSKTGEK